MILIGKAAEPYEPADDSDAALTFTLSRIGVEKGRKSQKPEEEPGKKSVVCYLQTDESLPRVGSSVRVEGRVVPFQSATNPGEFDRRIYQQARGYLFALQDVRILWESQSFDPVGQTLYEIRRRIAFFFDKLLGQQDGPLASAMVLGEKRGMDETVKSLYQAAGISHLLAISGLHVSLIGLGLFMLLRRIRLPVWAAAAAGMGILTGYACMTGMSVSVKRALLMFGMTLGARLFCRTADLATSLLLAAAWILVVSPAFLFDAGFQLSFSAVAGIAVICPFLTDSGDRKEDRQKAGQKILRAALSGMSVTLATLPFLLRHFHQWNPWSIPANLAVIPLMGILLPLLLLLAVLGLLEPVAPVFLGIAKGVALPVRFLFGCYRLICRTVLSLPGSAQHTGTPEAWQVVLFGAALFLLCWQGRRLAPLLRLTAALLLTGIFLIRLPHGLRIAMLDVGQGACVCVETPRHEFFLLDAGSASSSRAGTFQIIPYLKHCGVRSLSGIFISHWDEDHVNALEEIFAWAQAERIGIHGLYLPDVPLWDDQLQQILTLAQDYGVLVTRLQAGEQLTAGEVTLTCLHPFAQRPVSDRNDASLVLKLAYGDFCALFSGDLQEAGEQWLVERYEKTLLECDLLAAGHHGAANATGLPFLQAINPRAVLISCGRKNRYGHPAPETLERIRGQSIPYYVTAGQGAVLVSVEKDRMSVRTFLSP